MKTKNIILIFHSIVFFVFILSDNLDYFLILPIDIISYMFFVIVQYKYGYKTKMNFAFLLTIPILMMILVWLSNGLVLLIKIEFVKDTIVITSLMFSLARLMALIPIKFSKKKENTLVYHVVFQYLSVMLVRLVLYSFISVGIFAFYIEIFALLMTFIYVKIFTEIIK